MELTTDNIGKLIMDIAAEYMGCTHEKISTMIVEESGDYQADLFELLMEIASELQQKITE